MKKLQVTNHVSVFRGEEGRERKVCEGAVTKIEGDIVTIRKIGQSQLFTAYLGEDTVNILL